MYIETINECEGETYYVIIMLQLLVSYKTYNKGCIYLFPACFSLTLTYHNVGGFKCKHFYFE